MKKTALVKPRKPSENRLQLGRGVNSEKTSLTAQQIQQKYQKTHRSNILVLTDATSSMDSTWTATRHCLAEVIRRIMELDGDCSIEYAAYRDYCDGNNIFERSGWHKTSEPLLQFIQKVRCYGGGDLPEAVEYALKYAAESENATRVLLFGDAPPHAERDYRTQARRLAKLERPVFSVVIGQYQETIRRFKEISDITGGLSTIMTNADDILDLLAITVVDELGGSNAVENYLHKYELSGEMKAYAKRLALQSGEPDKRLSM